MRKTLLLFLLGYPLLCQAQNETKISVPFDCPLPYNRNTWLAGFQVGYSKGNYAQERYSATQVYGGYFVAHKLLVGLAATWGKESFKTAQDEAMSAGPMLRYQFTRTRFSPFIVGSYQFGQATFSGLTSNTATPTTAYSQDRPINSRYVGVGISTRVVAACQLDLLLTWQDKPGAPELGLNRTYNLLQAQIGVNYLISRKR